jgi:hypothetical protein
MRMPHAHARFEGGRKSQGGKERPSGLASLHEFRSSLLKAMCMRHPTFTPNQSPVLLFSCMGVCGSMRIRINDHDSGSYGTRALHCVCLTFIHLYVSTPMHGPWFVWKYMRMCISVPCPTLSFSMCVCFAHTLTHLHVLMLSLFSLLPSITITESSLVPLDFLAHLHLLLRMWADMSDVFSF